MFLIYTRKEWEHKGMRKLGFDFTDEELDNAGIKSGGKGYIGNRNGIACYLSEPLLVMIEEKTLCNQCEKCAVKIDGVSDCTNINCECHEILNI